MQHKVISYFLKFAQLSQDEIAAIEDSMTELHYPQGSFLLKAGALSNKSYFINSGCVRRYRLVDDNEITLNFYTEGQWILSLEGLSQPTPAADNLVCAEDTTVIVGNEEKAQQLFAQHPRLEAVSRVVMENVFAEQHELMTSFMTETAEQRYIKLLQKRPDLLQRIPQYQIASYIGVKPESLSRIRKRMSSTK